jgi:uncharacterized protein YndB with AHSA1/START domain
MMVHQERTILASPRQVFEAWTDPEAIARWYVDRAAGNPCTDDEVAWFLGGEQFLLEVDECVADERLVMTNVSPASWRGTVLDLRLSAVEGGTLVSVEQRNFPDALRQHVPNVDAGWVCTLALLAESLEHHAGQRRHHLKAVREMPVDREAVGQAFVNASSVARWLGEPPARLLAATPRGIVLALRGFSGIFTVMAVDGLAVRYDAWDTHDLALAQAKADLLVDRLAAEVPGAIAEAVAF